MDKKLTDEELQRYKKEAEMTPYSEPSYRILRLLSNIEQLEKDIAEWKIVDECWLEVNKQQAQEIERLRALFKKERTKCVHLEEGLERIAQVDVLDIADLTFSDCVEVAQQALKEVRGNES
jgi:uncharacterized membrane protein YccC